MGCRKNVRALRAESTQTRRTDRPDRPTCAAVVESKDDADTDYGAHSSGTDASERDIGSGRETARADTRNRVHADDRAGLPDGRRTRSPGSRSARGGVVAEEPQNSVRFREREFDAMTSKFKSERRRTEIEGRKSIALENFPSLQTGYPLPHHKHGCGHTPARSDRSWSVSSVGGQRRFARRRVLAPADRPPSRDPADRRREKRGYAVFGI